MALYTLIEKHENLSNRYAQVIVNGTKYYVGVERGRRVRIAFSSKWGYKWDGFVRDAQGKTLWGNYVSKNIGILGLLRGAGLVPKLVHDWERSDDGSQTPT